MVVDHVEEQIIVALRPVTDPELGYSIVDLGLIYDVVYDASAGTARVLMTFTSPACPQQGELQAKVHQAVNELEGVRTTDVTITFSPPWSPQMATENIRQEFAIRGIPLTR